jgi:pimeloyl-ACP methyl ester carboxylesterase
MHLRGPGKPGALRVARRTGTMSEQREKREVQMAKDLGVLFVHGIGEQDKTFADAAWEELRGQLQKSGRDPARIAWRSGHWADIVQSRQDALWSRLDLTDLDWDDLRGFVISFLADATAYRKTGAGHAGIYGSIHEKIRSALADLRIELGDADKPLIVVAHSLGGLIMSNYVWDAAHGDTSEEGCRPLSEWSPFERAETLVGFVTMGCNIPLFTLAYDEIESITFPPATLEPALLDVARWLNVYDRDDVLGYPIKQLSKSYSRAVTCDIEIDAGNALTSWNPKVHSTYWSNRAFINEVANLTGDVLDALR